MADPFVIAGPLLRFENYSTASNNWSGSVLVVVTQSLDRQPQLLLQDADHRPQFPGMLIDSFGAYYFWRFDIQTSLGQQERPLHYFVDLGPEASRYQSWQTFVLPAVGQSWHFGYYSGAAASRSRAQLAGSSGGSVWQELLTCHKSRALHVLLGGGAQVNNDAVFEAQPLSAWAQIGPDRVLRNQAPFTTALSEAAAEAYFRNYCQQFNSEGMRSALASIPQLMTWDDEDIFTLYGSFPDDTQSCPVFRGLFDIARRFYLLFQHHTTDAFAEERHTFLRSTNLSSIRQLGPSVAVLTLDLRSERTRERMLDSPSWLKVFEQLGHLPHNTRHLIVVMPSPLHYPKVPLGDMAAQATGRVLNWDRNSVLLGLIHKVGMAPAGTHNRPAVSIDEAVDQWASKEHWQERRRVVEQMQAVAADKDLRVTFLSSGTGTNAVAQFYSFPKVVDVHCDYRYMTQLIVGPVADVPASDAASRSLQLISVAHQGVNEMTKEKLVRLFREAHPTFAKLLPRRGWLEASELPEGNFALPPLQTAPRPAAGQPPPDLTERAAQLMNMTTSFLKKTYRDVRGEAASAEEDKVVVLPPTPGCLVLTLHVEQVPGAAQNMEAFPYVVPTFRGSFDGAPGGGPAISHAHVAGPSNTTLAAQPDYPPAPSRKSPESCSPLQQGLPPQQQQQQQSGSTAGHTAAPAQPAASTYPAAPTTGGAAAPFVGQQAQPLQQAGSAAAAGYGPTVAPPPSSAPAAMSRPPAPSQGGAAAAAGPPQRRPLSSVSLIGGSLLRPSGPEPALSVQQPSPTGAPAATAPVAAPPADDPFRSLGQPAQSMPQSQAIDDPFAIRGGPPMGSPASQRTQTTVGSAAPAGGNTAGDIRPAGQQSGQPDVGQQQSAYQRAYAEYQQQQQPHQQPPVSPSQPPQASASGQQSKASQGATAYEQAYQRYMSHSQPQSVQQPQQQQQFVPVQQPYPPVQHTAGSSATAASSTGRPLPSVQGQSSTHGVDPWVPSEGAWSPPPANSRADRPRPGSPSPDATLAFLASLKTDDNIKR